METVALRTILRLPDHTWISGLWLTMPIRKFADAIAFEVECDKNARLQFILACSGLRRELVMSPDDILSNSTVTYMEEIPATNDGAYWHCMESCAKFKVHQGWLTRQLALDLTYEDDPVKSSQSRTDFYYVRLLQRNGQRAWSSPVWVECWLRGGFHQYSLVAKSAEERFQILEPYSGNWNIPAIGQKDGSLPTFCMVVGY